jgi:hypothetical protein
MTASQTTSASYEVGYRKPPRHTQFQKGQSGNPGGRPRRLPAERLVELALYEAYRTTIVMEDGHATPMPAIQAVLRSQIESAASGNVRAQRDILAMIRDIERIRGIGALFANGGADDGVDTDNADAVGGDDDADETADDNDVDDNDVDDAPDADRDDAGGADDAEPARQQADGIDTRGERRQAEREPVELVARVEPPGPASGRPDDKLRETREHPFNAAPPPPGFAGAQPGLQRSSPTAPPAVSAPQPEDAAAPPTGGRGRYRPAQEARSGEAFCPAATVPNGVEASSLHGRSPGAAAVRRSAPAKSGRRIRKARGVRRARQVTDPARPKLQAGTRRPPLPNEAKN